MRAHLLWWSALIVGLVVQSTLLPSLLPDGWRPDFSRALVLWLALTGKPGFGTWYSFAAGLAVDAASGAPPGFTASARLFIYALARPARGILEQSPIVFVLGPIAVIVETAVVWMLKTAAFANPVSGAVLLGVAFRQSLVEVITVPVVFVLMELVTGHRTGMEMEK